MTAPTEPSAGSTRARVRRVVFEADTPLGRAFDVVLLVAIVASVLLVMFESVDTLAPSTQQTLVRLELGFTLLFSVEYAVRLWSAEDRGAYARSFFGVIDLAAVVPGWLSLLVPGAQALLIVRVLRLLRVFRVLKLAQWLGEANFLVTAVRSSSRKISVFLLTVLLINLVTGALMYVVEGGQNGFDNIFRGVYWSIVTMSTVGFGDITPGTGLGQVLASVLIILGYSIIAVPTGIVSSEMAMARRAEVDVELHCGECGVDGHRPDAVHCWRCGEDLADTATTVGT